MPTDTTASEPNPARFRGASQPFGERTVRDYAPGSVTVSEMLVDADILPKPGLPLFVSLDGEELHHSRWNETRPGAGSVVHATPNPRYFLAPILVGLAAGGGPLGAAAGFLFTFGPQLLFLGASFALSAVVNALTAPPSQKNADFSQPAGSPTIQGTKNQFYRNGPAWQVWGDHRIVPPYAAAPYTEVFGDEQFVRVVYDLGEAPATVSDYKIGATDIADFDDIEIIEHHDGLPVTLQLFPGDVSEESLTLEFTPTYDDTNGVDHVAETLTRSFAEDADEMSLDLRFEAGLRHISGKGDERERGVDIQIKAQRTDGGPHAEFNVLDTPFRFSGHPGIRLSYPTHASETWIRLSGNIREPFSVSFGFDGNAGLGLYQYTINVRPVGATSGEQGSLAANAAGRRKQFSKENGGSGEIALAADKFKLVTARTIRTDAALVPDGRAYTELRVRSSDALNGVLERFSCRVQPHVEAWNGSSWDAAAATRNPAWHATHLLRNHANVPDSRLDLAAWLDFANYCDPGGGIRFPHDQVVDTDTNARAAVEDILAAGHGSLHESDSGVYRPVWDEQKTGTPDAHFTPRNFRGYSFRRDNYEIPHAIRCKFTNQTSGNNRDELIVYADGYGIAAASSGVVTATTTAAARTVARSSGSFIDDGFQANTWATLGDVGASSNRWTAITLQLGQVLIESVEDSTLTLWPGQIFADGVIGNTTFDTLEATKFETLEFDGVTDISALWRHGRKVVKVAPQRSVLSSFELGVDYLTVERGDYALLSHWTLDATDARRWGRVVRRFEDPSRGSGIAGVYLDADVDYTKGGGTFGCVGRLASGGLFDKNCINRNATEGETLSRIVEFSVLQPADATTVDAGDILVFGERSEETEPVRVVGIDPLGTHEAKVIVQPHPDDLITDWLAEPVPTTKPSSPSAAPVVFVQPSVPIIEEARLVWTNIDDFPATSQTEDSAKKVRNDSPFSPFVPGTKQLVKGSGPRFDLFSTLDRDYSLSLSWRPSLPNGDATSSSDALEIQYRRRSDTSPSHPGTVTSGGGPNGIASAWTTAVRWTRARTVVAPLREIVSSITNEFDTVAVDVRVRTQSTSRATSDWVVLENIPVQDATSPATGEIQTADRIIVRGGVTALMTSVFWNPAPEHDRWRVRIQDETEIIADEVVTRPSYEVLDAAPGTWNIYVSGILPNGGIGPPSSLVLNYDPRVPAVVVPKPNGLRLESQDGLSTDTTQTDFRITWRPMAIDPPQLDNDAPADAEGLSDVDGYVVEVVDRGTGKILRREEVPQTSKPKFVYSYRDNQRDSKDILGLRFPRRHITFRVYTSWLGSLSPASVLSVSNPAPPLPEHLSGSERVANTSYVILLNYRRDFDFSSDEAQEIIIWGVTGTGGVSDSELIDDNIIYRARALPIMLAIISSFSADFSYRYAVSDGFSAEASDLNVSASFTGDMT